MNRDLKFRAICEYEHNSERFTDMIYFGMQTFENGLCVFPEHTDKIDYISEYNTPLMQFTGLHDKNGKEVFEGDVLNFGNNNPVEVKFENGAFTVFSEPLGWDFDSEDIPILTDFKYCEIIGNVFENPDLVKL